jgi:hypothetical protein
LGVVGLDEYFSGAEMLEYSQKVLNIGMIVRVALTGNNAFPSFGIPLGGSLPPV